MDDSRAPQHTPPRPSTRRDHSTALILGNGPSLAELDLPELDGVAAFGWNAAYRFWEMIDWRPTHYVCLDSVVGLSHKDAIASLIEEGRVSAFLLRENLIAELGELADDVRVVNFDQLARRDMMFSGFVVTTGAGAALWAASLGYRQILLAGIDGAYTELVGGAKRNEGSELEIVTAEENPNYFFQGYQIPGDRYQVPNPEPGLHLRSWQTADALISKFTESRVYNGNSNSDVRTFPFVNLNQILTSTQKRGVEKEYSVGGDHIRPRAQLLRSANSDASGDAIFHKAQLKHAIDELKLARDELNEMKDRELKQSASQNENQLVDPKTVLRLDMTSFVHCAGWHRAEPHGRWMGPSNESFVLVPTLPHGPCSLRLRIVSAMSSDILSSMRAWLDDHMLDVKFTAEPETGIASKIARALKRLLRRPPSYPTIASAKIPIAAIARNETGHVLKLRVSRTHSPSEAGAADQRQMSVCVRDISIVED